MIYAGLKLNIAIRRLRKAIFNLWICGTFLFFNNVIHVQFLLAGINLDIQFTTYNLINSTFCSFQTKYSEVL